MNQILYTGGKNKNGGSGDMKKIIIFFVVFIIIFGIAAILIGTNLLGKVKSGNKGNIVENNLTNTTTNTIPEPVVESEIKVDFESQVGAVKAIVTSKLEIKDIVYWWDEEEATTIEVNELEYEMEIPSKHGTHELNIEITDIEGYTETIKQVVIGASEAELPELTISTDGVSNYVITVKDAEEVDKIVIILNGETQEVEVNAKEFEHKIAIPQGDSLIDVTVYNTNGLSTNKKAKITNFGG